MFLPISMMLLSDVWAQSPPASLPSSPSAPILAGVLPSAAPEAGPDRDVVLSLRGLGEFWQDPHLSAVYRPGRISFGAAASWQLHRWLSLDVEVGYLRVINEAGGRFELMPLAAGIGARRTAGPMELFGGLGPALVPFSEDAGSVTPGTKLGLDVRAGVRVATGLYDPPSYPPSSIERVDLELFLGRRQHFGPTATSLPAELDGYVGPGRLDLSAWRLGVGLGVRL